MEIRTSTVAVVAASCITVGAAGAFLASRSSSTGPQTAPAADVAPGGVEQSEDVVADAPTIATPPTTPIEPKATQPRSIQPAATEPVAPLAPPPPPAPRYVDLVVAPDSVLGLQMETSISSDKAQVEDQVTARVTRDVRVGDRVAIPAGSTARGEV